MNVKITKISMSRGQTVQFIRFEPTTFNVLMEAELSDVDDVDKSCAVLSKTVQAELQKQIKEKELEMQVKEILSVDERMDKGAQKD